MVLAYLTNLFANYTKKRKKSDSLPKCITSQDRKRERERMKKGATRKKTTNFRLSSNSFQLEQRRIGKRGGGVGFTCIHTCAHTHAGNLLHGAEFSSRSPICVWAHSHIILVQYDLSPD